MVAHWRARYRAVVSGWVLAVGACVSIGLIDGMAFWAFALFAEPLRGEFGWTATDVSVAVSLTLLLQGVASVLVGRLVDRYGPRRVVLVGSLGVSAAYCGITQVTTLWQFYALLGLLAFFQSWVLYVPCTTLITRWFTHHRTTALSIVMSGFNLGGLLFLPLLTELLEAVGWRTAFATVAVLVLVLNGVFVVLMRDDPSSAWVEREAQGYDTDDRRKPPLLDVPDGRTVFATPQFWLLATGFALFYFSFLAFLYHGPLVLESAGVPTRYAALIFSCAAGTGLLVRLTSGGWLHRFERHEVVAAAAMLVMAVGLLVLCTGTSIPALTCFLLLWGVGVGIAPTLEPILAGRLFGRKQYATAYGALDGVGIVVSIPGPWLGSMLVEWTGEPSSPILLYSGALVLAAGSLALLSHRLPRRRADEPARPLPTAVPTAVPAAVAVEPVASVSVDATRDALPTVAALLVEGQALARAGERLAAHAAFTRLVERDPACEDAWLWRAATTADPDEAIASLETVLRLNPGSARAMRGLESLRLTKRVARLEARVPA